MDELIMFLILDGVLVVGVGLLMRALFHVAWRAITSDGKKSKREPKGAAFLTGNSAFLVLPIPVGYVLLYGFDAWGFLLSIGMVLPELLVCCTNILEAGVSRVENQQEESKKSLRKENKLLELQLANEKSKRTKRKPRVVTNKKRSQAPPKELIWD